MVISSNDFIYKGASALNAQVNKWEQLSKPDPICDEMLKYSAALKASHAAAIAEHEGDQDGEPTSSG